MRIDIEFEIQPVTLGEVFAEGIAIQEATEAIRVKSDGDAIVITTSLPVSSNGDSISIGGK